MPSSTCLFPLSQIEIVTEPDDSGGSGQGFPTNQGGAELGHLAFSSIGEVHPRYRTPARAILWQGIWAGVLTLSGTFEQLITFVMFITIAFWISATASVFTLRRRYPDRPRPYRTPGYPVVPLLFIVASTGIMLNTIIERPVESLSGLGLALLGIPVYHYWKRNEAGTISREGTNGDQ